MLTDTDGCQSDMRQLVTSDKDFPTFHYGQHNPEMVVRAKKQFLEQDLEKDVEFTPFLSNVELFAKDGQGDNSYPRLYRSGEYAGFLDRMRRLPMLISSADIGAIWDISQKAIDYAACNPIKEDEYVMAVPAAHVLRELCTEGGLSVSDLTSVIEDDSVFVRRSWCETNLDWMQVIPYLVFYKIINGRIKVWVYQRGKNSGEARIAGNYSIGVGGHVNPHDRFDAIGEEEDAIIVDHGAMRAIQRNILREVDEEVRLTGKLVDGFTRHLKLTDVPGLEHFSDITTLNEKPINGAAFFVDQSATDVERTHLGMFVGIRVPEDFEIESKEEALVDVGFVDLEELYQTRASANFLNQDKCKPFEQWSYSIIESAYESLVLQEGRDEVRGGPFNLDEAAQIHNAEIIDASTRIDRWKYGVLSRIFGPGLDFYNVNVVMKV
jgi:predicted NUDIX family phosphoesterase